MSVRVRPRLQPVLARATFVVTDSGGLQEESAHLGIPCAVHRVHTERLDGEGRSMVLTGFSTVKLEDFLTHYERYRGERTLDAHRPSEVRPGSWFAPRPGVPRSAGRRPI